MNIEISEFAQKELDDAVLYYELEQHKNPWCTFVSSCLGGKFSFKAPLLFTYRCEYESCNSRRESQDNR
jgi:hypothetical protein